MKKFHPFFFIGSIGMMVTSVLHIFIALVVEIPKVHTVFFVLYPMFLSFMMMGFGMTLRLQKVKK